MYQSEHYNSYGDTVSTVSDGTVGQNSYWRRWLCGRIKQLGKEEDYRQEIRQLR